MSVDMVQRQPEWDGTGTTSQPPNPLPLSLHPVKDAVSGGMEEGNMRIILRLQAGTARRTPTRLDLFSSARARRPV